MTRPSYSTTLMDGLWAQNSGLVLLLGLCPLLAVTTTLAYGLGLGLATLGVLVASNFLVSLTRKLIASHLRIPAYVLIIAGLVTAVDIIMQAWLFDLHRNLGLFVPLIVTNCAIIARAEAFASRHPVGAAVVDGFAHGVGFAVVLILMGFVRELLGGGTLFAEMEMLFGAAATGWQIDVYRGWLLFILPPGAFFVLAMLVAARNALAVRRRRQSVDITAPATVSSP